MHLCLILLSGTAEPLFPLRIIQIPNTVHQNLIVLIKNNQYGSSLKQRKGDQTLASIPASFTVKSPKTCGQIPLKMALLPGTVLNGRYLIREVERNK